jgi:hypothetical protein
MTVSFGGQHAANNGPGVKRWWVLMTASGRRPTEWHPQRAAAGIKQLAAGAVWQALNIGRRVAGGGTAQTMSCRWQAASGKQRAVSGRGPQGTDDGWPIDCLAMGWYRCCCVVGLPETTAVGVCADVLDVREGIASETAMKLMHKDIKIL